MIKDLYSSSSGKLIGLGDCYSESEKEVGCWVDGKPLYQKTKVFSNISKSGSLSFGVTNAETVFVYDIGQASDVMPIPYVHGSAPDNNIGGFLGISASDVTWEFRSANSAPSTLSGFMTIRYTKTTDTAGSGNWTPDGIPAVHYSSSEQIIGTWTDGKTLYQRTINFTTANDDNYNSYDTELTDIDIKFIDYSKSFYVYNNVSNGISPYMGDFAIEGQQTKPQVPNLFQALLNISNSTLHIDYRVGSNAQNRPAHITIQYTKVM